MNCFARMTQLTRIGSYLVLLLGLLLAAQAMNSWLQRQTQAPVRQLNDAAIAAKREQFNQVAKKLSLHSGSPAADFAEAGRSLGAKVALLRDAPSSPEPGLLFFWEQLDPKTQAYVSFPPPPVTRLIGVYHRVTLGVLLLCPVLLAVGLLIATLARRGSQDERASRQPWTRERTQGLGIEHFAKLSNERTVALAEEHASRLRAEEDLLVNRTLLNQSVDERIRLGRELHDNICQTLYAVCLTLESVQKKNSLAPELSQRVTQCMAELRRLNHEVRNYLEQLEPASVNGQSFAGALNGMIDSFAAREDVRIDQRLDAEAVALIAPALNAEIVNILREAVSNSLRHGRARRITLLAGRGDREIALAVQDDGAGFTPGLPRTSAGHGLGNMQARAAALGGNLRVESAPGKGTRVLLTLPVASPA
ncbi:MAG: Histidine kinase, gyrase and HSP90-like ATPase [Lacunisphaera sp.]|nr:Histidine kinase, gyrase and HSP90-like ATPase [Lacunisphaera sp.]